MYKRQDLSHAIKKSGRVHIPVYTMGAVSYTHLDVYKRQVTDLHDWKWRSDLKGLEVRGAAHFTEYSKDGYRTDFTVTKKIPCERWEFELENEQMRGRWTGVFIKEGERTRVVFTEDITCLLYTSSPGAHLC